MILISTHRLLDENPGASQSEVGLGMLRSLAFHELGRSFLWCLCNKYNKSATIWSPYWGAFLWEGKIDPDRL